MKRNFSKCPRCGSATKPTRAFSGAASEFWLECTGCNTYINTYIPQEHQEAVHADPHRYKGNFGGYGTGKTTTSRQQAYKHWFITPNGNTLIGAMGTAQYEQTLKRDIENDLPNAFIKDYSAQKNYMTLVNGHRVMYRPYDDEGKLRSYNLSMWVIVEASEVQQVIFEQLKTRLRSTAATIPETDEEGNIIYEYTKRGVPIPKLKYDWREGIVESNPDPGWVRTELLEVSDKIYKFGDITDEYKLDTAKIDERVASFVASTDVNAFLPAGFVEEISKNKPLWWVLRYVKSSFSYAEGLVYPKAIDCIVPEAEIPKEYKRIIAFDYGLSDDAVFLFGAIDERAGKVIIYKEVVTKNNNIEELVKLYKNNITDIPDGGILNQLIDPKSGPKRDYNKRSLMDLMLDYGILFQAGHVNKDARIFRLNTYIESGKLAIMSNCTYLIGQLKGYKYPERILGKPYTDKPIDRDNHAIDPLEWIVMDLPADPKNLIHGVYNRLGQDISRNGYPPKVTYDPLSENFMQQENPGYVEAEGFYGINYADIF